MDILAYLQRINYLGSRIPTAETLRGLHRAHMLYVPFENMDIHLGRPIVLDEASLFDKIVTRRRGGFCYELNGLFAALLRQMGFDNSLLSARVVTKGQPGPEFDHLILLGILNERYLIDVGFGDSFREPLYLDKPGEQIQPWGAYRLTREGPQWTMWKRGADGNWTQQYLFTLQPRKLADFAGMCHYHQTSPESNFTRKRLATLATPDGRLTLSDMRLICTTNGDIQEYLMRDEAEYAKILTRCFGIRLF